MSDPVISTFVLGDYQTNCFVVQPERDARTCWIVDCGFQPEPLLQHVSRHELEPAAVLLTHCHSDHIAGLDLVLARFGRIPVYVHAAEAGWCSDPMLNLSALLGEPVSVSSPDHQLWGGETLSLAGTSWRVLHTPGHSPGGVTYVHDDSAQAIVGDTLFAGSIGRYDFPTSNAVDLRHSIRQVIMALPDDTTIYPGHGPATTIGRERAANPFVIGGF